MNRSKKFDQRYFDRWKQSGAFKKDPEKLAHQYNNKNLEKESVVYQIWSNGLITFIKPGKTQSPVTVCESKLSNSNFVFPCRNHSKYTFAYVSLAQAKEIRAAMGQKDYHDLMK